MCGIHENYRICIATSHGRPTHLGTRGDMQKALSMWYLLCNEHTVPKSADSLKYTQIVHRQQRQSTVGMMGGCPKGFFAGGCWAAEAWRQVGQWNSQFSGWGSHIGVLCSRLVIPGIIAHSSIFNCSCMYLSVEIILTFFHINMRRTRKMHKCCPCAHETWGAWSISN